MTDDQNRTPDKVQAHTEGQIQGQIPDPLQAQDADAALEALLHEARTPGAHSAEPMSERLFAAILADAAAVQAAHAAPQRRDATQNAVSMRAPQRPRLHRGDPRARRHSVLASGVAALGGWGAVSGLVAASCTGLWIGFAGSETLLSAPGLNTLTATYTDADDTTYETFDLASVLVEDMQ